MIYPDIVNAAVTAAPLPQAPQGGLESFVPLILIFVVFYFLLIRPQQKKMKEHQNMLNAMKRGDRVVTSGGMYGTISAIKSAVVEITIADNVKVMFSKSSVAAIVKPEEEALSQNALNTQK